MLCYDFEKIKISGDSLRLFLYIKFYWSSNFLVLILIFHFSDWCKLQTQSWYFKRQCKLDGQLQGMHENRGFTLLHYDQCHVKYRSITCEYRDTFINVFWRIRAFKLFFFKKLAIIVCRLNTAAKSSSFFLLLLLLLLFFTLF